MRLALLVACLVLSLATVTSAQSGFEDLPLYHVAPGLGVGQLKIGMSVADAQKVLAKSYGEAARVSHFDGYDSYCVGEHVCAFSTEGSTVDTIEVGGDSRFYVRTPRGEALHLLSAGADDFVKAYGKPDCERAGVYNGQKVIVLGWEKPGIGGIFYADSDTLMVAILHVTAPGAVCN